MTTNPTTNTSIARWLGIAAILIILDQITKIAVTSSFTYGESMPVTSFFNLVLVYNKGAAFSFLASESGWQRHFFTAAGLGASIFIIYLLKKNPGKRLLSWALTLILGGAIGNVIDRVLYGHVIDFLDIYFGNWHWPAFNIADSAICIGALLFVYDELRSGKKPASGT